MGLSALPREGDASYNAFMFSLLPELMPPGYNLGLCLSVQGVPVDPKLFLLLVPRAWDNLDAEEGREARLSPRELVGILKNTHSKLM